jgi:O-antigen ligase/tetratricopeptide (TPR) repeat protein
MRIINLEQKLIKILRAGVYLLLFAPLIVTPGTIFPFSFGRGLFIQAIIGVLFGAWLALIYFFPKYRPKKTLLTVLLSLYFLVILISAILGLDFGKSFWGNEERMDGIFITLHYFALFFILQSVFKKKEDWKSIFSVSLVAGALTCVVALMQGWGLITLWGIAETGRISGTIGNPIFLAGYLSLNLFFSIFLFFESADKKRILYVLSAGLIFLTLFLTETRGALMAVFGGFFIVLAGYAFLSKEKKYKIIAASLILLSIILGLVVMLNKNSEFIRSIPGVKRLSNISLTESTASTRLITWSIAYSAWKEYPVFGWGPNNFLIAFNKHYNPVLIKYSLYETWFDKAHNVLFDHLTNSGIAGVLSYLSLFLAVIFILWKNFFRKEINKNIAIIFTSVFAVYFAQNLFAFDDAITTLLFFVCLAYVNNFEKKKEPEAGENKAANVLLLVFIFISLLSCVFNWKIYKASVKAMEGNITLAMPIEDSLKNFEDALTLWTPYKEETRVDLSKQVLSVLEAESVNGMVAEQILQKAESATKENIAEHPNYAQYYFLLGRLYTEMIKYNPEKYFGKAKENLEKAVLMSPKRQQFYYGIGRMYFLNKEYDKSIMAFEKMVELEPASGMSHWSLGIALLTIGNEERGYEEIRASRKYGQTPKSTNDIELMSEALMRTSDYDGMLDIYEDFVIDEWDIVIVPSADFCAKIAAIYAERGEKEKAKEAALRAASIDPAYQAEAELFIKMLE